MSGPEPPDNPARSARKAERRATTRAHDSLAEGAPRAWLAEDLSEFVHVAFDAMPTHVAILDEQGRILAVNTAWRRFADANGFRGNNYGVGRKYLDAPESSHGEPDDEGRALARGIQEVLANQLEQFQMEYTCSAQGEQEWYQVRVNRLGDGRVARAVVAHHEITEVKRAQMTLGISEEGYRFLFENSPLPMWVFAEDTLAFLAVNEAAIQHYQYSRAEFLAMTIRDIRPPEEVPRLVEQLARERAALRAVGTWKHRKKDGTSIDVEIYILHTEWAGKRARLVLAHDVTEQKRIEAELRESEDRYRDLVENSSDLICTHDLEGRILSLNPAPARILGYSQEEMLHANIRDFLPLEKRHLFDEYRTAICRDGAAGGRLKAITRSGEVRIWEYHNTLRTEGVPAPIVRGMAHDITERKRAEAALRESEERFRQLAANIRDIFWLYDLQTARVLYVSPAFEQILGHPCEALYHRSSLWTDSIHPADQERAHAVYLQALETGVIDHQYRVVRPDGSLRWLRERGFGVRDERGVMRRFAGIAEDITEREQLEDLLRQAQKMEAIGQLAGGIAHDFNNLLTIILGYCEQLKRQPRPEMAVRSAIEEIHLAANRGAALTRQLLAFSRKQKLEPQVLDLNVLISEVETILRRSLGEDIELVFALEPNLLPVKLDRYQFEQVVLNLAVNARDSMPSGGRLTLATSNAHLDEAFVRSHPGLTVGPCTMLSVTDTGAGMDTRTRARIFEPFFTTKEAGKGTGLGLATVYGIVKQSGAAIVVESEPGTGTCFRIYLPAVQGFQESAPAASPEPFPFQGRETILLVEDDDRVRQLFHEFLEQCGYSVKSARNAAEALQIARNLQTEIQLLLTDLVMPGMSGVELARAMARERPGIRLLFVSGHAEHVGIRDHDMKPGSSFLQKPFSLDSLGRKLRDVLDGEQ